jgi:hypothetical protein
MIGGSTGLPSLLALVLSTYNLFASNTAPRPLIPEAPSLQCPDIQATCKCDCHCVFENKNLVAAGCAVLVTIAFLAGRLCCRGSSTVTVSPYPKGKSRGPFEFKA